MKISMLSIGVLLLAAMPVSYGGSAPNRTVGPCFRVSIQNEQENRSNVQQNCDRNINRTVQAGARNTAQTMQTGNINDNRVRQYHYDVSGYFDRKRGN